MKFILQEIEVRVLGSLLEKELATPEYYPLSLNALQNACNQKTNREPVVAYDEKTVARALEGLREKQLAEVTGAGRVPKYGENLLKATNLLKSEAAALCVLLLRGPQTAGEVKGRTDRMHRFASLAEVESSLQVLEQLGFAQKLPRQPGQKESRYAHLLMGEVAAAPEASLPPTEPAMREVRAENERLARMEQELETLRRDFEELKEAFLDFKKQFE
ncbi:MAG: hypothetical protein A2V67_14825 [Deltaproteobacteria bacterium RBG_13_61_14]|nr:MAG: hypothetical protein A2V67_14825 [Deltaproteobacteria bacterium RBG_13_61_14]